MPSGPTPFSEREETPMTLPQPDYLIIACHPDDAEIHPSLGVVSTNGEPMPHEPERARGTRPLKCGKSGLLNRGLLRNINAA